MNINKIMIKISIPLIFVILLFAPFFYLGEKSISFINISLLWLVALEIWLFIIAYITSFIKKTNMISFVLQICTIFLVLFSKTIVEKVTGISYNADSGFYILSLYLFIVFLYYFKQVFSNFTITVNDMVEMALFSALAIVFDMAFLKIRIGTNGGSISLTMLPLLVLSLRKGALKGFIGSGIIFGFITCLLDGYGIQTYPFDYLLAFGAMGLIGLFRQQILFNKSKTKIIIYTVVAVILCLMCRTLSATISGMVFYGLTFVPSLIYQLPYILPSGGVSLALLILLLPVLKRITNK